MESKWQKGTLGDFVALQRGHDLTDSERRPGSVPVMGSAGQNGFHDKALAPGPGVVIGRSGASFGKVHYCPKDYWPHNTVLYATDFKGNDPRFAYYCLSAIDFSRYNSGSAQPSLNRNYIYSIPLLIPELAEQQAIACILGTLDDKIELNQRMNETLEGMARAIFKSWFVDFDPVRARAAGQQPPGLAPHIADLFPDAFEVSELGEIPKGWKVEALEDVIEIHDSKRIPLSKRERAKRQGEYPYYGATGIMDYVDDFIFDGIYVLMAEDGSVIDSEGHPVLQYVWGQFWVNNHAHVLRGAGGMSTEQLFLALQGIRIDPYITGAVQLKLNQRNMKSIPLVLATENINLKFQKIIEPLFESIRSNVEQSRILTTLRDTLLPRLISGELRVPDAERIVRREL